MKIHVIGCAGAGMSGVLRYFAEAGDEVSGCDAAASVALQDLRDEGFTVFEGHDVSHVRDVDVVVASPAVTDDLAERRASKTFWDRATLIATLAARHRTLAVAGTHGKTTTTSMLVAIADAAGVDPSWLCGQPVRGIGANGHFAGRDLVLETDESFGTFRLVEPEILGVLNVEADHLDYYGTVASMEEAYQDLARRTTGFVVAYEGRGATVTRAARPDTVIVGTGVDAAVRVRVDGGTVVLEGLVALRFAPRVLGAHNVANAAVAATMASLAGYDHEAITRGLESFVGAPRRFERRRGLPGRLVIDDYAHLPSEVRTTLQTAADLSRGRVVALFQPHRVTRTKALAGDFATSFAELDALVVCGIYTAGEGPQPGVTGSLIADAVRASGTVGDVRYVEDRDDAAKLVASLALAGDTVVVLGAGDVGDVINYWEGE